MYKSKKTLIAAFVAVIASIGCGQETTLTDYFHFRMSTNLLNPDRGLRHSLKKVHSEHPQYIAEGDMELVIKLAKSKEDAEAQYLVGLCFLDGWVVDEDDSMGFERIKRAASLGHAAAQNALGTCYYNGEGTDPNEEKALSLWSKAAEGGDPLAQWTMGWINYKNPEKAVSLWTQSARQGFFDAQVDLATAYFWGVGVPAHDIAEAYKWITLARVSGYTYNPKYRRGRGKHDNERYDKIYNDPKNGFFAIHKRITEFAAGHDYPEIRAEGEKRALAFSQKYKVIDNRRRLWDRPNGRDEPHMFNHSLNTANQHKAPDFKPVGGFSLLQHMSNTALRRGEVGEYYMRGEAVPRNLVLAYMYFVTAKVTGTSLPRVGHSNGISSDDVSGMSAITNEMTEEEIATSLKLARDYLADLDIPEHSDIAEIRRDAESGDPHAQRVLSWLYFEGHLTLIRDDEQGLAWVRKAAEQGEAGAQYDLAMIYLRKEYTLNEKDDKLVKELLLKSARGGYSKAQHILSDYFMRKGDVAKSEEWRRKSALQGYAPAQWTIGLNYLYNHDNVSEAYKWVNLSPSYDREEFETITASMTNTEALTAQMESAAIMVSPSAESKQLLDLLLQRKEEGSVTAAYYLKRDYLTLAGDSEFMTRLKMRANAGHKHAQYELAECYTLGETSELHGDLAVLNKGTLGIYQGQSHPNKVTRNFAVGLKWYLLASGFKEKPYDADRRAKELLQNVEHLVGQEMALKLKNCAEELAKDWKSELFE